VLREAATNIARHARARAVRVALRREDGGLVLEVVDDGRGGVRTEGNGLAGMRERVAALGGRLALVSPPGAGTRLRAWLPWPEDRPAVAAQDGVPAAVAPEQPA
jgi:two-component system sensor histidine kinase DesK